MLLSDGTTDYVYGPDGTPVEQFTATGSANPLYYFTDSLGSTVELTGSTGTVAGSYAYTPWGAVASHTGNSTPIEFAGAYADTETSLYYLQARYYDPATALFLTVDPQIGTTLQAYLYVGDNPLNLTDPTGLWSWGDTFNVAMIVLTVADFVPGIDVVSGSVEAGLIVARAVVAATRTAKVVKAVTKVAKVASRAVRPAEKAAATTARAARGGETAATKYGREMHQTHDYGPGYKREERLPSGKRVDAINHQTRHVIELKPDNPKAVKAGNRQLNGYLDELNQVSPGNKPWTGSVHTYKRQ